MSEQVQHPLIIIGIEQLKSLLFKNEKYTELLNKQHKIYLAVNESAQRIAYKHKAYGVVTFDLHGVRAWHFDEFGASLAKCDTCSDIKDITKRAKKKLKEFFDAIETEEWQRKYAILESVIDPERAKKLQQPEVITHNFFGDSYTPPATAITTKEERKKLDKLGIEVVSWEVS